MPQLAQRDVVKQLIAARRISVPAVSLPAGWLICMTTSSFAISLTELEELDVISELLEHSRLEIKCEEEVAWTFAMFAGKIPFQPLISQRADALEFLANLTQQEASIGSCTQVLRDFSDSFCLPFLSILSSLALPPSASCPLAISL